MFKRNSKCALVFILLILGCSSAWTQNKNLKLWYQSPAGSTWEAALPVGNGRIAGMVYGNPDTELLKLNSPLCGVADQAAMIRMDCYLFSGSKKINF